MGLEDRINTVEGELDSYTAQGRTFKAADARRQLSNLRAMRPKKKPKKKPAKKGSS